MPAQARRRDEEKRSSRARLARVEERGRFRPEANRFAADATRVPRSGMPSGTLHVLQGRSSTRGAKHASPDKPGRSLASRMLEQAEVMHPFGSLARRRASSWARLAGACVLMLLVVARPAAAFSVLAHQG